MFFATIIFEFLSLFYAFSILGFSLTVSLLVGQMFFGSWLLRRAPTYSVAPVQMIAGFLLLMPGFFSDIVAVFLMLPWTRKILLKIIWNKFSAMQHQGRFVFYSRVGSERPSYRPPMRDVTPDKNTQISDQ